MKTKKQTSTRKSLLQLLLVAIAFCSFNTAWAFKASFTYSIGSAGAVTFTSTSTGTTASTVYYWYAGDGSYGGGKSATTYSHTYAYNGTYTVQLHIQDTLSWSYDSAWTTITITNSATCNLHADPRFTLGSSGMVNFSSSTSTGVDTGATYQWWFGDGGSAASANPSYSYANNGTYYASLTITNAAGCSSTVYDTVIVTNATGKACNAHASFSVSYGLNGHVSFTSTSTGVTSYSSFYWLSGDGASATYYGTTSTFNHIYTANGTYKVIMQLIVDTVYCSSTDTIMINVTNVTTPCTLSSNYTYTVAASGVVNFTSTATGTNANTEYFWNPGDGTGVVKGGSTFSHTYVYQGVYYPWLTVRDTGSAYCVDSNYEQVSQYTADSNECHLKANFSYSVGVNGHVSFTNTSTTISNYLNSNWKFGDGSTDFTNIYTDSHIYTANGTYTVTLTSSADSTVCLDSIVKVITISNITIPCTLSASFNISNDTTKGMVNVTSTSTGTYSGTQYSWKADSSGVIATGSSTNLHFSSNGIYTVWLIVRDTGTAYCIDSIAETVNVSNVDSLHASFTTSNPYDTLGNYQYMFTSTSTGVNGVTMYKWDAGDTTGADSGIGMTTYQHYYRYPGTHIATLSIWFTQYPSMPHHGSTGVYERYDFSTYSMPVDVGVTGIATINNSEEGVKLYPNPNNGTFKLSINGMENSQNAELQVTNILGEVVYQTTAQITNGMLQQDINLQNINTGTYFVRIITPNKVLNTKTIITR